MAKPEESKAAGAGAFKGCFLEVELSLVLEARKEGESRVPARRVVWILAGLARAAERGSSKLPGWKFRLGPGLSKGSVV